MPPYSLFSTQRPEGPSWHISQIMHSLLAQNLHTTPGTQNKCQSLCYGLRGLQKMAPFLSTSSPTRCWVHSAPALLASCCCSHNQTCFSSGPLLLMFPLYEVLSPQHPHGSLPHNRQVFYQRSPSQWGPPQKSYIKCHFSSHLMSSLCYFLLF